MSNKDDVFSALSSFISAFAGYAEDIEVRISSLELENKELRDRNTELAEVFTVAAKILNRGNI